MGPSAPAQFGRLSPVPPPRFPDGRQIDEATVNYLEGKPKEVTVELMNAALEKIRSMMATRYTRPGPGAWGPPGHFPRGFVFRALAIEARLDREKFGVKHQKFFENGVENS